jgi:antitoxin component YwqK of YwqJK toxin-antitoxin module
VKYEINYLQGELNGIFYEKNIYGSILQKGFFKDNLKDSLWEIYSNYDGALREKGIFLIGKKEGVWIESDLLDETIYYVTYENDKFLYKIIKKD